MAELEHPDDDSIAASIPGALRAAAVVLALGPELARGVLCHLDDSAMRMLARGARHLKGGDPAIMQTSLRIYLENMGGFGTDVLASEGMLRELVAGALGLEAAERAFSVDALPPPPDAVLAPILEANRDDLALLLSNEKAPLVALVLGALPHELSADVLSRMPEEIRSRIIESVAGLRSVSTEVLEDLVKGIAHELVEMGTEKGHRDLDGFQSAVELIRRMDESSREETLREIEEHNPALADKFKTRIFVFDDVAELLDRHVQLILREVDVSTLTVALKSAPARVKEKILANMSTGVVRMLVADLDALGPVRLSDVEAAREQIAARVVQLAADERITLVGGGEEML